MKETGPAECSNLVGHGQLTVQQNAKVIHNSGKRNHGVQQTKILDHDLIELLASTQPDDLLTVNSTYHWSAEYSQLGCVLNSHCISCFCSVRFLADVTDVSTLPQLTVFHAGADPWR